MLALPAGREEETPAAVVVVPHPRPCMAAACEVPAVAHIVWLYGANLSVQEVCKGHMLAMQAHDQPCAFAPLDSLPPIQTLAASVQQHLMRQAAMQARMHQPMWVSNTGTARFTTFTWQAYR